MCEDAVTGPVANAEMAAAWDGDEGEGWARHWQRHDRLVSAYHEVLLAAAAVARSERVLDVGCGNGQTTRDAARSAADGRALGVDLSSPMLERARKLARLEGLANVDFEQADAQVHPFAAASYDVVVSRFGVMFFADPVAAFANIGAALPPGGRMVVLAWRDLADNEWLTAIRSALAVGRDLPSPPPGAPGPLGLADADRDRAILHAAGFDEVELTPLDRPLWFGTDADDAFAFAQGSGAVRGLTEGLAEQQRVRALDQLRTTLHEHATDDGVQLGSAAWLITARWRGQRRAAS
ncbi:MAG: class I SAM-dependent methyltransferase [Actinobacteria bacterium]|nr:class I SAM-dependent methyltransferase [Actinomycetota bacterium]